ncbi:TraR/DksA family transcriptional regulator [Phreatobacter sp.]|uniref:TraR/DksA family transcriptional regulator n=1 Tax=Phreatobacter sp. TaxID=1966341 RepID=UPI003F727885
MTDPGQDDLDSIFRPKLEAERQVLEAEVAATAADRAPVELDQQSVGRLSRMDALQVQAMAEATQRRRQVRLQQIGAALDRMAAGDYGFCLDCGEFIGKGRLGVDPAARLCIACAGR